jgi:transposase
MIKLPNNNFYYHKEMLGNGFSRRKIGNALNIPKSIVIDVCAKYSATRSVENKKRSGRNLLLFSMNSYTH